MAEAASTTDWKNVKFQLPSATYQGLPRVTAAKHSSGLAASTKKYAYTATLQEIAILPFDVVEGSKEVERAGRAGSYGAMTYAVNDDIYHVKTGKTSSFTDLAFDSFDPLTLYTTHTDGVVKGWAIPDDMTENLSQPKFTVEGVGATVNSITLSDTVSDLITVNSQDLLACIAPSKEKVVAHWDITPGKKDQLYSSVFSCNSSVVRACCSNKTVYTVDTRIAKLSGSLNITMVPRHIFRMDENDLFMLIGHDSFGRVQCEIWDPRNTTDKVWKNRMNKLNGDTIAHYEIDSKLLYVGSRLATNHNLYDVAPTLKGKDFELLLEENLARPCFGFSPTPKHKCSSREVARCNVLLEDSILPVQTIINTQLFEKCVAPTAAMTCDEWLGGQNATRVQNFQRAKVKKDLTKRSKTKSRIANVLVQEPGKQMHEKFFAHVNTDRKSMTGNHNIRMNDKYIICPLQAIGGAAIGIVPLTDVGNRFDQMVKLRGHKSQVSTLDISWHQKDLVVTGSDDGTVYLWKIPDDVSVKKPKDLKDTVASIECWDRVRFVRFHPHVKGILIVSDFVHYGDETKSRIRVFDVTDASSPSVIHEADVPCTHKVVDLDIDPSGTRVVVATQGPNESFARVFNMQSGKFESEFRPEQTRRALCVRWLSETEIVTAGHNMGNKRSISVWSLSDLEKHQFHEIVDTQSGAVLLHVDTYHRLIYFAGIGQGRIRTYEVLEGQIYPHGKSHMCWEDIYGLSWLPKPLVDVRKCEMNMAYRLGRSNIVPVSIQLMRKRKDFFQDDVYMKVRPITSQVNAKDFSGGASLSDDFISLQPEDMMPLSLAPSESETPGEKMARRRRSDANMAPSITSSVMSSEDSAKKLLDSVKVVQNASAWAPGIGQWVVEAEDGGVEEDEWSD